MNTPKSIRRSSVYIALIAMSLGLAGLARSEIVARGSDSTLHVVKALAAAFEKSTGQTIRIEGGGSGAGAKAAIAGDVQIAFLSRALHDKEKAEGLVGFTYAIDAVVPIAHPSNSQGDVTLAELKAFYSGTATTWRDGRQATLFNRNTDSGTREVFQEIVLGKDTAFSDKAALKHDGILISSVTKIPTALAYISVAEATDTTVKVLSVNGVAATPENLRNHSYPIIRTPTLATKGEAQGVAKAFIDFVLSPAGQAVVAAEKLLPIK